MSDRNDNGRWVLPEGWVWTTLGDIATLVGGGTPSRQVPEYFGGDIVWLTPTEIPKNGVSVISASRERITNLGLRKSSARVVPKGSVLLTSRASIGYVAIAGTDLTTNQGFASFIPGESVDNHFLAYWLKNIADDLEDQATGTTFKEISKSKLRELAIPLAPLPIQHLIVSEIEKQFTRLDAAVAALRRAKANLARYKAAVLQAAVEGRLVTARPQRSQKTSEVSEVSESASDLLARILAERRAQWEAANPKKPYVEPKGPDVAGLPGLPVGWVWATVEQVADHRLGKMLDKEKNQGKFYPYLRNANVRWFMFDLVDLQSMRLQEHELENVSVRHGDLVVCEGGEPGRAAVWEKSETAIIQKALHRVRPYLGVLPWYLAYCLAADAYSGRLETFFTGSTIRHFTGEAIRLYPFPLPPLHEQERIVAEVQKHLSQTESAEQVIDSKLTRAERLRQGVLGKAFRGELVANGETSEVF